MSIIKKEETFPSIFSDFFETDRFFTPKWFEREFKNSIPAVNIKENAKEFNIEFAAPGFNKGDFKIDIEDTILTISAEKKEEKKNDTERFTRREFSYNSFSRSFNLPQTVNGDKIDAKYSDGILKLNIPKKDTTKAVVKKEVKIS